MAFMWSCVLLWLLNIVLEVTDGLAVSKQSPETCVIGAGYSGLATARYLKQYDIEFTVFEATKHIGGTWRFDPHVGTDEDGVPLFTSMYKNLRTNTPRETMEFAGYALPENTPSYPTGTCFYNYIKSFAKHFGLIKHIQFQTLVTSVKWTGDKWNITYTKTDTRNNESVLCDFVVVANGHYCKPVWPKFEGAEKFEGKIIHSHDYKEPETYKGRRVLLVGAGPSGLDLATHLVNVTAKLVHSHHLVYNQPNFPKNYIKKPDIKSFTSNGVIFQDGSFEEVDDVIYCTGFEFDHPFLDESCGVTRSGKFLLPLYQHMVNIRYPNMVFLGLPKVAITRTLDVQAEYAAALAAGKFELPSQEEMLKSWLNHVYSLRAKGKKIIDVNLVGDDEDQYFANLTQEAGIVRAAPVLTVIRDFNAKIRLDDLLNYRDYDYKLLDDYSYKRWYNPRTNISCPVEI